MREGGDERARMGLMRWRKDVGGEIEVEVLKLKKKVGESRISR